MPGGKTLRNKPSARSKTMRRTPASSKTKTTLVPLIKQVARSQALKLLETKFTTQRYLNVSFNSPIDGGFAEMYPLIPKVNQTVAGAAENTYERLGDTIQPLSIKTNWHIALGVAPRTSNIRCVLYCLQHKSIKQFQDLAVYTQGPNMLKTGTVGLTSEYGGRIVDENLPINTDEFTLLKKFTFNLMSNVGVPNNDTTAGNSPNVTPSFKNLSYTYKVKGQLKYTPPTPTPATPAGVYPNGHAPFWVFGYSHTDGSAADVLNRDVIVSALTQITYKDA